MLGPPGHRGQLHPEGLVDIAPNRTRRVTHVTQKSALELIDVMMVLACAGFEWGAENLTDSHLTRLRQRLDEFTENLRLGNVAAAAASGADFSTIVILASGNKELQTHVDLVVARTLRLIAVGQDDDVWQVWVVGYREVLALLETAQLPAAVARYRRIYVDYRAYVQRMLLQDRSAG